MNDIEDLLSQHNIKIPDYRPGQYRAICPTCSAQRKPHHQRLKCLSVKITADEHVFWNCHHCDWTGPKPGARDGLHHYYDDNNRKTRRGHKDFSWEHQDANGEWVPGTDKLDPCALYGLEESRETGGYVLVVEGEKDVDNLIKLGFAAVCNAHGAGKWAIGHSTQLRGRDIVVLNDNDAPGYQHAANVIACSRGIANRIRRLDLKDYWPEIGPGDDVSDWLARGGGSEEWLERIIDELPEMNGHDPAPPTPSLPFVIGSSLNGVPVKQQEWTVRNLIPARQTTLYSGHGAAGKSMTMLHLCAAHALGRVWLNFDPLFGKALFVDAEDEMDVIHRRLDAIMAHYEESYLNLDDLHLLSLAGQSALLATPTKSGRVEPTDLYKKFAQYAGDVRPVQIVISSAANCFAGNENDRSQVQQFIQMLTGLAMLSGGSVILIAHPSRTGLREKDALSGSTAWHNSVRARMALSGVKEEEQTDNDLRLLQFFKNQYGPAAENLTLKWTAGLFLVESTGEASYDKAAREAKAERVFLDAIKRFLDQGRPLSHKPTSPKNYAPKQIAKEPEAEGLKAFDLEQAMERLFRSGKIRVIPYGRNWEKIEIV